MFKWTRYLVVVALLPVLILQSAVPVQGAPARRLSPPQPGLAPSTPNAGGWYDGLIQYSSITNCVSIIQGFPYQEAGAGVYTGFFANPDAGQPAPNTTYYVHVVVAGLGNSCSGQRAYIDLALPANTSLAITPSTPVGCYYDNVALPANECPQSFPASAYNSGSYAILSVDSAHALTWPIPQGRILEIRVPVRSSAALTNSPLRAHVWMLDGNSSPWLHAEQGVYVFSSQPTIIYPSPSTINLAATTARSQAYLYTYGATGTGYFDLGTTTAYGLIHDPLTIGTPGNAWLVWDDWGPPALLPDTLYHWRFTFTSGGQTYYGADQTFRTLPSGLATIGTGTAGSCNSVSLAAALGTAQTIGFNCGALPITLTLSSTSAIARVLTIDGNNKVALDMSGAAKHFQVASGGNLNLKNITLAHGNGGSSCGGAIGVEAGGQVTLDTARLIENHSNSQGGALCNYGTATISDTLFQGNSANLHGGAIGNYGQATISRSRFAGNQSGVNGGAIDTTGTLNVSDSSFASNAAGFRGGGINNYLGTLTTVRSSFTGNTGGMYGGGLANDGATATAAVDRTTFNDNSSPSNGGAVENTGTLSLTNSTLSGNSAGTPGSAGNGGGLYWGGGAGMVTVLNSTLANNSAQGQGGNIYAGGAPNSSIRLKNSLVAAGSPTNCDSTLASQGNNLESANTCGFTAAGDVRNAAPRLGPLQNNGGPNFTRALLFGSPAIDAGTPSGCPAIDQRGVARPQDGDRNGSAVCDIGAFESTGGYRAYIPRLTR